MQRLQIMAPALLVLFLAGCGDGVKRVPVYGKVTAKGGKAVDGAFLVFVARGATKGEGGSCMTDDDGNYFVLEARTHNKGIQPGEYVVRVSRYVGPNGAKLPADVKPLDNPGGVRQSIPQKYYQQDNNPLKFTVGESGGEINIEIPEDLKIK